MGSPLDHLLKEDGEDLQQHRYEMARGQPASSAGRYGTCTTTRTTNLWIDVLASFLSPTSPWQGCEIDVRHRHASADPGSGFSRGTGAGGLVFCYDDGVAGAEVFWAFRPVR